MLEKLKEAFDLSDEMIMITDDAVEPAQAEVIYINEAYTKVTGYQADEIQTLDTVISPDTDPVTLVFYKEARRKKKTFQGYVIDVKKSGEYFWVDLTLTPFHDARKDEWFYIHKPRPVEEYELINDRTKLFELMEISTELADVGLWEWYPETGNVYFSKSIDEMLGADDTNMMKSFDVYKKQILEEDRPEFEEKLQDLIETGEPQKLTTRLRRYDTGEIRYLKEFAKRYKTDTGFVKVYGIVQDITEDVNIRKRLEESEERWEKLVKLNPDLILILNDVVVEFANQGAADILNFEATADLTGKSFLELISDDQIKDLKKYLEKVQEGKEVPFKTYSIQSPGSKNKYLRTRALQIEYGDKTAVLMVGQDVTRQVEKQTQLKNLLAQKQTLMQEIHHRVKNNMAVISGLLDLQKERLNDREAIEALSDSQMRLQTIAQVHEQLYQEKDLTDIQIQEYLGALINKIKQSFRTEFIEVKTDLEKFKLNVNQAIPLGLMLNELITNAFKHAFREGEEGVITIQLQQKAAQVQVCVSDNGIGIPEKYNVEKPETLGYTIIQTLKRQLNADLDVTSTDEGTAVRVRFDKQKAPQGSASNL